MYCSKYSYHLRMTWILLALANFFYVDTNKYVDPCSKKWQTSITYFSVEMTGSQCGKMSWKGFIFGAEKNQVSFGNFSKFHNGIIQFFNIKGVSFAPPFLKIPQCFVGPEGSYDMESAPWPRDSVCFSFWQSDYNRGDTVW